MNDVMQETPRSTRTDLEGVPGKPARTSRRGFAAMDQKKQKQIASMGGRAAHERGQAHEFTSEEARNAGRKGGQTVSQDRAHMAAIGKKGGVARGLRHKTGAIMPASI